MSDRDRRGKRSIEDESVVRALRAYQAELEAGDEPDRAAVLALFPDLADELAGCLDGLDLMYRVAPQLHGDVSDDVGVGPDAAIGDFRIVREVGRGGMGVVYEAEQISLDRRVALKVLPFAAVLDARYLRRFRNEAQAAAHLHHTNIVPVHAVGSERGVHYYAMQFIEGRTLAGLVDELQEFSHNGKTRDSSPALEAIAKERTTESPRFCRAVAHLGIQAAEALDYAHESGVVHRDIKPANLIVDGQGHLWITDFGLASTRKDTGLTMTGDLVGTLRYMSPEQAQGKRVPVDHRTDIYSLAVTLYELLTLRKAFPGDDQATVIRDIALREPTRPRALNAATPAELETILLKGMAKDPADRYATAQELADDLRRFTEDRPIHARRPSAAKRAMQWSRRHPAALWAAGAVLVLTIAGLVAGNVVIAKERDDAQSARTEATEAHAALESNFEKMRELVDSMLTRVAGELEDQPRMENLRRELLEEALAFYLDFLKQRGDEPRAQLDVGRAYERVGLIYDNLGRYEESKAATQRAITTFEQLAADSPDVLPYRSELASAVVQLGGLYDVWERPEPAVAALRRALALWEAALQSAESRREPDPRVPDHFIRHQIVRCSNALGKLLYYKSGKPDEAMEILGRATEISDELAKGYPGKYRGVLAGTLLEVGQVLMHQRRFEDAEKTLRRCRDVARDSVRDDPSPLNRGALAQSWSALASVLGSMGRLAEAEQALNEALPIQSELARDFPSTHRYRFELGDSYFELSHLRLGLKQADGGRGLAENAQKACLRARTILGELADQYPTIPTYRFRLARTHFLMSIIFEDAGQQEEAKEESARAVELLDELEDELGSQYEYRGTRAQAYNNLCAYLEKSDPERSEQLLERCIAMNRALVRDYPDHPLHQHELSTALTDLAHVFLGPANRNEEAEKAFLEAVDLEKALVAKYPETPDYRQFLIRTHLRFAGFCTAAGDPRNAVREYRSAVALAPGHPELLNALAWLLATCPDPTVADPHEAVRLAQRALESAPKAGAIWNTLGVAQYRAGEWKAAVQALEQSMALMSGGSAWDWLFLAMAHGRLGDEDEARAWYDKAAVWIPDHAPRDAELERYRAEAATLLGVAD